MLGRRGPFLWLPMAFAANVLAVIAAAFLISANYQPGPGFTGLIIVTVLFAPLTLLAVWKVVELRLVKSVGEMAVAVRAMAHGEAGTQLDQGRWEALAPLPEAVNALAGRLADTRRQFTDSLASATARAEEEKGRLAAILHDLHQGVLVCNLRHQVVLYNQTATLLLDPGGVGLGRSLFGMVSHEPVLHTLDLLTHRRGGAPSAPFLSATAGGGAVLQGRMSLIRAQGEVTGYVITFDDAGRQIAALGRRDTLLRELLAALREPLGALPASTGTAGIAAALERAEAGWRALADGWWPMADIHSGDLAELVVRRLQDSGITLHAVGLPVWLHGDSHTLVLLLEALIRAAAEGTDGTDFDLEAELRDGGARLDVVWRGDPLGAGDLARLLDRPLAGALGGMTVRDALMHHSTTLQQGTREGVSWLWLPLARGASSEGGTVAATVPARPEFFDFDLLAQDRDIGNRGAIPLRSLTYVVFDTETTGLSPSQGDQIVSIAGVRIVNGRILTGESFSRIVNPGRPIPPESVKFHGITDSMVTDRPPIGVVLPQFKAFCADAVLVAHNAAFDLKFIRMREAEARVTFDNPVLDTMLLSSWVDGSKDHQSLDAIAERYGITVTDRHTALGDAMVTAALLMRLIEALEERGLNTLDDAVRTLNMTWELHNRAAVL